MLLAAESPPAPAAELARRDRILILCCLFALAALAWAYLFYLDRQMAPAMEQHRMMAEMGMPMDMSWSAADAWFNFAMWVVMMVGMMAPSAAPVMLLFAGATARRGSRRLAPAVLGFGAGYALVWIGFSVCATLAQWLLHETALLSPMMTAANPMLGGAILMVAGLYQLTPLKGACLAHCRSPLGFLLVHWRDGALGALQMGLRHGSYCLGCCWALMCVLFAVGVMNLVWVAALALFVLLEKAGPGGAALARAGGAAMMLYGALLLAG